MPRPAPSAGGGTLSTAQLAAHLGRPVRTVRRWLARGQIPCLPAPPLAHRRVDLAQLRARLDELVALRAPDNDCDDDCDDD